MLFKANNGGLIGASPETLKYLSSIQDGVEIDLVKAKPKKRTGRQNNALHLYLDMLSDALNNAGLDMRKTLKEDIEIPWNRISVKEHLWRPIQEAVINIESTADADTKGYNEVYEVLHRHMSDKHGINVLWPSYLDL